MADGPEEITDVVSQDGSTLHISRYDDGSYVWSVELANGAMWATLTDSESRELINDLMNHFDLCDRT